MMTIVLLAVFAGCLGLSQGAVHAADGDAHVPFVLPIGPDGVQRATVTLDSYSYSPRWLVVDANKPVELTLTSVTTITPHNFIVKDSSAGLSVERDVGAGKTVTVTFTPTRPGIFPIYCDKKLPFFPSHREKGMEGTLEVK